LKFIEVQHLKRFCRKHGIDEAEIDSAITYYENLEILKKIVNEHDPRHGEPEFNFFPDYAAGKLYERCFENTESTPPLKRPPRFSLEKYVESRREPKDA
jgi:inhibitor of KinA sporulation pathway (predicted exonuclease)